MWRFFLISMLSACCGLFAQYPASSDWILEGYSTAQGVKWLSYHQDKNKATIQILDADLNKRSSFSFDLPEGYGLRYCYFLYDTYLNSDKLFEVGVSIVSGDGASKVILYNETGLMLEELEGALGVALWPASGVVNSSELSEKDVKLQVTEFSKGIPIYKFYALPLSTVTSSVSVKSGEIQDYYPNEDGVIALSLPLQMPMGECSLSLFSPEGKVIGKYPVKRGDRTCEVNASDLTADGIYYYDVAGVRSGFKVVR